MKTTALRGARRRAFTLIEILVVISIIAILAALILGTTGYVQEKAGTSRAEAEIQALTAALESYKVDNGTYPEGDGSDTSTRVLIDELNRNRAKDNEKIYFEFPAKMLSRSGGSGTSYEQRLERASYLVDPFGNPYRYEFPGDPERSGEAFFDLWSQGKKNSSDTNLWIKNW